MNINDYDFQNNFIPSALNPAFEMEDWWVWCGSVIKDNGKYHMFASRWPKYLPFHPGWGMASEIVRAESDKLEGPYEFKEVVLGERGSGYWDGRSTHNPSIQKYKDTFILFYTGMTYPYPKITKEDHLNHFTPEWLASRASKRIGIATSKSIKGPWIRSDKPAFDIRAGYFDDFFVSNPAPCVKKDGSVLLVYKTRTYKKPPYDSKEGDMFSTMKLGVAYTDFYTKPFVRLSNKPLFDEKEGTLEDPFIWEIDDGYSMIAKDWMGTYTNEQGSGVYAKSTDGIHWDIKKDFKAFSLDIPNDRGTTTHFGNMDRPFLYMEDDKMLGLFVAVNDGNEAGFKSLTKSWNAFIPLK
jgi:hypothetical protein